MDVVRFSHTNYARELKPGPDGHRRWALKVFGAWRVYTEVPLLETTAAQLALMQKGEWSPSRDCYDYEPGRKTHKQTVAIGERGGPPQIRST